MVYSSTRLNESNETLTFSEAVVRGIAPDGGLYVPAFFPKVDLHDPFWITESYQAFAKKILSLYLDDFTEEEISSCVESAYDDKFTEASIAPIKSFADANFIELYHGRTSAFKDMALSILPYLLKTAANKLGTKDDIVILTATSGDTGKAALEGFADVEGIKIMVFYPTDGVSEIQRKQMTSQEGENVSVVGIKGNFDEAQNGVKHIFLNSELRAELAEKGYVFSSANSINIGRLLPQIVYYVHAYFTLVKQRKVAIGEAVNIVVPTGNFGNILAAYYAKQMGLPFDQFICASNVNHVLTDFIQSGVYDIERVFKVTNSPSMDILISSNLERFLHAISDGSTSIVSSLMSNLKENHRFEITDAMRNQMKDFHGGFATDQETIHAIKELYEQYGYVVDTHTAVAYKVYKDYVSQTGDHKQTLIASTASPFKFADDVAEGLGLTSVGLDAFDVLNLLARETGLSVPETIRELKDKPVLHPKSIAVDEMVDEVRLFLR
ncbi:MAG TPA: threonine synthase [Clostridiales bacterium UBA8960]|nr:threonine synthase [Clostridiales bacterium UBA8960]